MNSKKLFFLLALSVYLLASSLHAQSIRRYGKGVPMEGFGDDHALFQPDGALCDTVDWHYPVDDTLVLYTSSNWGFVVGHNGYGDLANAERFANHGGFTEVYGVRFTFLYAAAADSNSKITVHVWPEVSGQPGSPLNAVDLAIQDIIIAGGDTFVTFPSPVVVNGPFYVGFSMTYSAGDTVGLATNSDLDTDPATTWEQFSDSSWYAFDNPSGWGLKLSSAIYPMVIAGSFPVMVTPPSAFILSGDSVQFSAGGATTYQWYPSTGLSCNNCPNPVASPTTTTTYTVVGALTGSNCPNSTTAWVGIYTINCYATFSYAFQGLNGTFQDNSPSSGTVNWRRWDFGDGDTLATASASATHAYASPGNYLVTLDIYTTDGCHDQTSQSVSLSNCNANFYYTVNAVDVTVEDFSSSTFPVDSIQWDFGDGNTLVTANPIVTHSYANPGTYNVTMDITTTDTCMSTTNQLVVVLGSSTCSAYYTVIPDTMGQYSLLIINYATGNNLSYLWTFGDGDSSTLDYPWHQYAGAGNYQICLTVTDNSPPCTATFCDTVAVTQKMLSAFSIAVVAPTIAASAPVDPNWSATLFPNPCRDNLQLRLRTPKSGKVSLAVFDTQGRMVLQQGEFLVSGNDNLVDIPVEQLPSGLYLLALAQGERVARVRFVVDR